MLQRFHNRLFGSGLEKLALDLFPLIDGAVFLLLCP